MANHDHIADLMERDAATLRAQADRLARAAESVRATTSPNVPIFEMRKHLAVLGFAVVSVDALVIAESCMENLDSDDGMPEGCSGTDEFEKAHAAVREAIQACHGRPRANT